MAKTKISEFSATANSNTDINSINIAEGCAPSNINDAIRELMAELKDFQAGTKGDSFNGPVGSTTAAAGAFTTLSSTGNTTLGDASADTVTINGTATFANANPTLSAGTANGVLYLNGSKVATSGSALTFDGTNFASTGSGTLKNLLLSGGTLPGAGNPSIALRSSDNVVYHQSGSANTIVMLDSAQNTMQSIGATAQIWNISNTEQMRLTSTGLGIGTSSPSQLLQARKDQAAYTWMRVDNQTNSASAYAGVAIGANGNTWGLTVGSSSANSNALNFVLDATGTNASKMTIDSSGNLGLGVTPSAWSGFTASQVKNGSIASTGNDVFANANCFYNGASWRYIASATASQYYQDTGAHIWRTAPSGTAGNAITFTQALTLDANRNLLLNGTSAGASSVGTFTIFNGTAPTGSVTDGVILFAADVSSSSELRVRDEAGNVTTLSPHNFSLIPEGPSEELAWAYYSEKNGKKINVDMLKLARMVEKLTGEKLVFEE